MKRKCFLVAELVPNEGLSTRKLLLETAYYNVITAYSVDELLDAPTVFPGIDAVVVHADLLRNAKNALPELRAKVGTKPILLLSSTGHDASPVADVTLPSHDPQVLLSKLRDLFGEAKEPKGTR